MTTFYAPVKRVFQTLWDKEKMLVTSIFSFSPKCFPPYQIEIAPFEPQGKLWTANAFNMDKANILSSCKGLNISSNDRNITKCHVFCMKMTWVPKGLGEYIHLFLKKLELSLNVA